MSGLRTILAALAAILLVVSFSAPASAQLLGNVRTFVSSTGSDANSCNTRAQACATFQRALDQVIINGEINCLDTYTYGAIGLQITKSVTINCTGTVGSQSGLNSDATAGVAISINIPVGSPNDPNRTVRLRGLSLTGTFNNGARFALRGIEVIAASAVFVENVVISDFAQQGISDHRTGGQTRLYISDSVIRNNGTVGIALGSQGPSATVLDNVILEHNSYGLGAGNGNSVTINRSVISGNSTAGVEADPGAQIMVNNSGISHNNLGVQSASSVRLSNTDIAFNNTAISGPTGSFGNNRLSGNGAAGTNLIPLGGPSSDVAQQ